MTRHIGIVISPYHPPVARMTPIVRQALEAAWGQVHTTIVEAAGCFEIPLEVQRLLQTGRFDAVITLGAIEVGETGHGEQLASAVFPALLNLGLRFERPVALGIIGPRATPEQIEARAEKVALEAASAVIKSLAAK
jgi:6,7-dimethyl-8-ribityllumazine synthase